MKINAAISDVMGTECIYVISLRTRRHVRSCQGCMLATDSVSLSVYVRGSELRLWRLNTTANSTTQALLHDLCDYSQYRLYHSSTEKSLAKTDILSTHYMYFSLTAHGTCSIFISHFQFLHFPFLHGFTSSHCYGYIQERIIMRSWYIPLLTYLSVTRLCSCTCIYAYTLDVWLKFM